MKTLDSSSVRRGASGHTSRDVHDLMRFAAVAIPVGWVLLSLPIVLDQPFEPYVLGTLVLGLVVPALVLTHRDPAATIRGTLLRDLVRLPRPVWLLVLALVALPGLTWLVASVGGTAEEMEGGLLGGAAVNIVSSLLIVNLWDEMAWTGLVQRRAMRAWGMLRGSAVTAVLFAAIHAPLAADVAHDAGDIALNAGILLGSAVGLRLMIGALDRLGGQSLLAVAVLHASFNAAALFVHPSSDWVRYVVTMALGALVVLSAASVRAGRQT